MDLLLNLKAKTFKNMRTNHNYYPDQLIITLFQYSAAIAHFFAISVIKRNWCIRLLMNHVCRNTHAHVILCFYIVLQHFVFCIKQ